MVGPAAQREAVAHLRGVLEMSERRACSFVAADRKMIRYRSRRPPDTELRGRLREIQRNPTLSVACDCSVVNINASKSRLIAASAPYSSN